MARRTRSRSSRKTAKVHRKPRKTRATKKKMNAFMKTMLNAKKSKAASFKYNGKTRNNRKIN